MSFEKEKKVLWDFVEGRDVEIDLHIHYRTSPKMAREKKKGPLGSIEGMEITGTRLVL